DELIASLAGRPDSERISRPTVYRTLNELIEAGLLRKMSLGGRAVYEHDYGYPQHDHLHCQICDKLIEFQSDELAEIRDAVAREHNFRVTGHRLIISGVCHECSRKRHRGKSPLDLI
ncbi:MAG: transcriptional repressor, partial [Pirellulales bacterium]